MRPHRGSPVASAAARWRASGGADARPAWQRPLSRQPGDVERALQAVARRVGHRSAGRGHREGQRRAMTTACSGVRNAAADHGPNAVSSRARTRHELRVPLGVGRHRATSLDDRGVDDVAAGADLHLKRATRRQTISRRRPLHRRPARLEPHVADRRATGAVTSASNRRRRRQCPGGRTRRRGAGGGPLHALTVNASARAAPLFRTSSSSVACLGLPDGHGHPTHLRAGRRVL